jgi:putative ABC transport system ATP-binding protein
MSTIATPTQPLKIEHLAKSFRQGNEVVHAIRDVSLTVEPGQFLAVMGASGSGKSTLLHVIAGLTRPDQGRIVVDGQELSAMSDRPLTLFRRRHIGLVFQAFNLIPTLSAQDNILLPALASGNDHVGATRLDELLARLGLSERRHHRPDALSGGEQQRVAIARALINDPALLLADEPTGSLDSVTGQKICRLLRELSEEQRRTIVLVTHEPAVAVWAQRVVVMKDGCILDQFDTAALKDAHTLATHYQDIVNVAAGTSAG